MFHAIELGLTTVRYCKTAHMRADFLTKALLGRQVSALARDEFRFVSNGATVGGGDRVEDLPASHAAYGGDGARAAGGAASDDDDDDDDADAPDAFGCGGVSCQAGDAADAGCAVM